MRRYLGLMLLLVAALALGVVAVQAKEPTYRVPTREADIPLTLVGEVPSGYALRTFSVEGICCQSCAGKLAHALEPLTGVERVAVDPRRKEVQVLARAELAPETLAASLTFDEYVATPAPGEPR